MTRTVLCIRHGESTFNAAARAAAIDPLHFDARLSAIGREQVRQARTAVLRYPVELVITSPLTRALQTTAGLFDDHLEDDFARVKVSRLEEEETHHGRKERRTYFQMNVPRTLAGREEWVGLATIGMVIRTREINGDESGDVQYYISTLKRNVTPFARVIRNHWGIENTCHWSLDVTFREDHSRARDRNVAENLSWLRRFALGLLKQHPDKKTSLVGKRRKCGWSTRYLSEVLFGKAD